MNPDTTPITGPHIGTWMIQSYTRENVATGDKTDQFGLRPSGYLMYGADGRMSSLFVRDGRRAPTEMIATGAERIDLYGGMIAYGGTYVIEGDLVRHTIDTSWNQAWTGTVLVRRFKVDGDKLTIRTLPSPNPVDGIESSSVLIWQRFCA